MVYSNKKEGQNIIMIFFVSTKKWIFDKGFMEKQKLVKIALINDPIIDFFFIKKCRILLQMKVWEEILKGVINHSEIMFQNGNWNLLDIVIR